MSKRKLVISINVIGFLVGAILVVSSFFVCDKVDSLLVALGANFITSVLCFDFINLAIELVDKNKQLEIEIENEEKKLSIISKQLLVRTGICILQFNELTQPFEETVKKNVSTIKPNELVINNFADLFQHDLFTVSKMGTSIIEAYYESYLSLKNFIEKVYFNIPIIYNEEFAKNISDFLTDSEFPNGIETLIEFNRNGNKVLIDTILDLIKNYKGVPEDDIKTKKYNGNLFLNVLNLYQHLVKTKKSLSYFQDFASSKLKNK